VGNIFPEVGQLPQRAFQAATSSGSKGGVKHDHVYQHNQTDIDFLYRRGFTKGAGAFNPLVFLKEMQVTSAGRGLPPTLPFTITSEDRQMFMNQMATGLLGRK
jgi:phage protein D